MQMELSRGEADDLLALAEGTGDGRLDNVARRGVIDNRSDAQHVRDQAARGLESRAAERHGLVHLEGLYERLTDALYDPDSQFHFG